MQIQICPDKAKQNCFSLGEALIVLVVALRYSFFGINFLSGKNIIAPSGSIQLA